MKFLHQTRSRSLSAKQRPIERRGRKALGVIPQGCNPCDECGGTLYKVMRTKYATGATRDVLTCDQCRKDRARVNRRTRRHTAAGLEVLPRTVREAVEVERRLAAYVAAAARLRERAYDPGRSIFEEAHADIVPQGVAG